MNRAERRSEKVAFRRAEAILHERLLPGGCPKCHGLGRVPGSPRAASLGRVQRFPDGSARVRWLGMGHAVDVLGVEAVDALLEPVSEALMDDKVDVEFWVCECGAAGVVAW